MKRFTLALGAMCLVLAACDKPAQENQAPAPSKATELKSGIDMSARDTSVRPQDDFFEYVNGHWVATTAIPGDQSRYGTFNILRDNAEKDLREIIEESAGKSSAAKGSAEQQIGDLYNSFMNEEAVNAAGIQPLQADLARIDSIKNLDDIAAYIADSEYNGLDSPFGLWINQDLKDVENYILYVNQNGLGLPDRDYYFDDSEKGQSYIAAYKKYIETMLGFLKHPAAAKAAEEVLALETTLAANQWTRVENRDDDKTYNKMTRDEVDALMPDFSFITYLKTAKLEEQSHFIVRQPNYLTELNKIFKETPIATWQDYFRLRLISGEASMLSQDIVAADFDFYSKTLRGVEEQRPRWKRAVSLINSSVGELVGQTYVAKHFPPEAKARMLKLVNNLKLAYADSIKKLDWMSEETKQKALEKLSKFTTKIGYPDKWRDYSDLDIKKGDLFANNRAVTHWLIDYEVKKLGAPLNRDEWFMTPQTVNAYYNPPMNEIVFPAAILQPPFFNMEADDAVNYGAIGAVIGHEIGHGFDDQGSKYDGDGYLRNWWTDEDLKKFRERTNRLVAEYNSFKPLPDTHVNGELTLGENIGDLSGVSISYKAYQLALAGEQSPEIEGLSGDQRFFMGYAQAWRFKSREEALRDRLRTDPHSPPKYRVNGVLPNVDKFYTTFDVKEGDGMWVAPEDRVRIW